MEYTCDFGDDSSIIECMSEDLNPKVVIKDLNVLVTPESPIEQGHRKRVEKGGGTQSTKKLIHASDGFEVASWRDTINREGIELLSKCTAQVLRSILVFEREASAGGEKILISGTKRDLVTRCITLYNSKAYSLDCPK